MDDKLIEARQAQGFLNSSVWKRAYQNTRNQLVARWEKEQDAHQRDVIWHTLQALAVVETELMSEASTAYLEDMTAQAEG
jgi:hypothetical protein